MQVNMEVISSLPAVGRGLRRFLKPSLPFHFKGSSYSVGALLHKFYDLHQLILILIEKNFVCTHERSDVQYLTKKKG